MTKNTFVSVLMPAFNREIYIASAIESVLNSNYSDFELIIVDDNSNDSTYTIAKEYVKKDKRVQVHRNDTNLGQFPNRNRTAGFAKGVYLKYLDSDDMLYPHTLQVMVDTMKRYPDAAFGFQHSVKDDYLPYPIYLKPSEAFEEHFLSPSGLFNCGPSGVIFNREFFLREGGFKTSDTYVGNDTELLIRLGLKYPVIKLQPALVWWRKHEGQSMKLGYKSGEYFFNEYFMQVSFLNGNLKIVSKKKIEKAIEFLKWKTSRKVLLLLRSGNFRLAAKMIRLLPINFFDVCKSVKSYKL